MTQPVSRQMKPDNTITSEHLLLVNPQRLSTCQDHRKNPGFVAMCGWVDHHRRFEPLNVSPKTKFSDFLNDVSKWFLRAAHRMSVRPRDYRTTIRVKKQFRSSLQCIGIDTKLTDFLSHVTPVLLGDEDSWHEVATLLKNNAYNTCHIELIELIRKILKDLPSENLKQLGHMISLIYQSPILLLDHEELEKILESLAELLWGTKYIECPWDQPIMTTDILKYILVNARVILAERDMEMFENYQNEASHRFHLLVKQLMRSLGSHYNFPLDFKSDQVYSRAIANSVQHGRGVCYLPHKRHIAECDKICNYAKLMLD